MTDQSDSIAAWWSPDGWQDRAPPAAYVALLVSDDSWEEHKYTVLQRFGDADGHSSVEVFIWKHGDHLAVQVSGLNAELCVFFVSLADQAAFIADKLPAMLAGYGLSNVDQWVSLNRLLIAFVRHGHGERTVSDDGLWTLDEARRRLARQPGHEQRQRRARPGRA